MKRTLLLLTALYFLPSATEAQLSTAAQRTLEQMLGSSGRFQRLVMEPRTTDPLCVAGRTVLYYNTSSNVWRVSESCGAFVDVGNAADVLVDADFSGTAAGHLIRTGAGVYSTLKHNLNATADPEATDDSAAGYSIGSVWINTTTDVVWDATDVTVEAAVWKKGGITDHGLLDAGSLDDDDHSIYARVSNGAGAPAAGSVARAGHIFADTTNSECYIGFATGGNFSKCHAQSAAYTQHQGNSGSRTPAAGGETEETVGVSGFLTKDFNFTATFTNQPSNDGVEVLSSAAGDTTQTVTIWGTTTGTDNVVSQTVTLNGTTAVATVKVNWGNIKAIELSATTTGNITIREASGDLAITTITAGGTKAANLDVTFVYPPAPTDDNILVGNGELFQAKSVPNCTDTGGNHLNYTQSTNAFSCGTSGGGTGVAPVIRPYSAYHVSGNCAFDIYNSQEELYVADTATNLTADCIQRLRFQLPMTLPTGTLKALVVGRANATANNGAFDTKWCVTAPEADECTVATEGTTTITWAAGDANQRKESKVILDAAGGGTITAGYTLSIDFTVVDASHTLAVESGWRAMLIWE